MTSITKMRQGSLEVAETATSFRQSALRNKRVPVSVSVFAKPLNTDTGIHGETQTYTALFATHERPTSAEVVTDVGNYITATDLFMFAPQLEGQPEPGDLPDITAAHEIEATIAPDTTAQRYGVERVQAQGGETSRLFVWCNKVRTE